MSKRREHLSPPYPFHPILLLNNTHTNVYIYDTLRICMNFYMAVWLISTTCFVFFSVFLITGFNKNEQWPYIRVFPWKHRQLYFQRGRRGHPHHVSLITVESDTIDTYIGFITGFCPLHRVSVTNIYTWSNSLNKEIQISCSVAYF